jgi:hypothetical protein
MRLSAPGVKNAKFDQKLIESISFSNRFAECTRRRTDPYIGRLVGM